MLAGFENHGGRTHLGPRQRRSAASLKGHGNDGRSRLRGGAQWQHDRHLPARPLLPKNAWFADWLIARALRLDAGELRPLDDALERAAHLSARRAAGV